MRYLDICELKDGETVQIARLFEDGRFEGNPAIKEVIESLNKTNPDTGKEPTRGKELLSIVGRRLSNGYLGCFHGSE